MLIINNFIYIDVQNKALSGKFQIFMLKTFFFSEEFFR